MKPEALPLFGLSFPQRARVPLCAGLCALLVLAFGRDLVELVLLSLRNELHSHIPLVPLIAGYLFYVRADRSQVPYRTSPAGVGLMIASAAAALSLRVLWHETLSTNDALALAALAFVSLILASGFLCLGSQWMTRAGFPVAFLVFIIPMPDAMAKALEGALVLASADVSAWLFRLTGTPLLRDGNTFALPGITLEVAQECSGIRSSWVLFITSLIAAHRFLQGPWRRLFLVFFVIPLGIVRNAFRILVIGLLCVHVGPHMIDSVIHRRGGPLFFLLSLGPLFALLLWLRPRESRVQGSR